MFILWNILVYFIPLLCFCAREANADEFYSKARKLELREQVRSMFYHAYEGYLQYASGYDELRPLTCDGVDTWGSYSLTLVDALDTLAVMGNFSEFRRVAKKLESSLQFDRDINVSVFETNIRIVGGLLSAHLLSKRAGIDVEPGWPCAGPLLRLAEDITKRLLPAFNTSTGMPYGTVNLLHGVPKGETAVTCTAGVGTLIVEFGTLSRLTGDSIYEKLALNAIQSLWKCRSNIGLFGNHIDVQTGRWTAIDAGIGAGVDSFYEYLIKGSILLQKPELLAMFYQARGAINRYLKLEDWYMWANMHKGQVSLPVFQSLDAFWPGSLSMTGDITSAVKTFAKYNSIWLKYGFLPESYNIPAAEISPNREGYPLRPELIESALYLYRLTKNHVFLETGENVLKSIQHSAKTKCGYATIRDVYSHERENRMESFFLSETTKYLYLLFDEENFLHENGGNGHLINTKNGECVVNSGPYIFNTEAHPVDMSALYCCHDMKMNVFENFNIEKQETIVKTTHDYLKEKYLHEYYHGNPDMPSLEAELYVDIEILDEHNRPAEKIILQNFEIVENENIKHFADEKKLLKEYMNIGSRNRQIYNPSAIEILNQVISFLKNNTLNISLIDGLKVIDKDLNRLLFDVVKKNIKQSMKSLWQLYLLWSIFKANESLLKKLNIENLNNHDEKLDQIWIALTTYQNNTGNSNIYTEIEETYELYKINLINTTAMQGFLQQILITQSNKTYSIIDTPLLNENDIQELYRNDKNEYSEPMDVVFNMLLEVLSYKRHVKETINKMNFVVFDKTESTESMNVSNNSDALEKSEELLLIKDLKGMQTTPLSINSSYDVNSQENEVVLEKTENNNKSTKYSKWLHLINSLLRKTTTATKKEFDLAELKLQTERLLHNNIKHSLHYDLLTCFSPEFLQLFAYNFYYPE